MTEPSLRGRRVFPGLVRGPVRFLLRSWSHIPRAHGYLYHLVEEWGGLLSNRPLYGHLANGATVLCDLSDSMQRQIYFLGAYEPIATYLFALLLQPGMVAVDAGANIGQYTLLAALQVGAHGAVHAFEPVPRNFERLEYHVRVNKLDGIVQSNMLALWAQPETLHLRLSMDEALNSGAYTAGETSRSVDSVLCEAVALDAYVRATGITRLDVIKMDIEGAEWFALQGARDTLSRWHPSILMELNRPACRALGYQPEQTWEFLRAYGYHMWLIGPTAKESRHVNSPPREDLANVIFHTEPLPESVLAGWSLRSVRAANARRGRNGSFGALLSRMLAPAADRW